ncbi:MAG: sporulation protein YqfD [Bacilli bacterium]|nr:sporulation protein YqfD [Bacilli bacterium]
MNNLIIIKVKNHINRFIKKCINHQISLLDVNYLGKDTILVTTKIENYKKIKRLNYYSDINIIKYLGFTGTKKHLKKNIYIYIVILFCFLLMEIITNFIVKIDIIHENSQIRKLVANELTDLGIKKYSLAKDFNQLEEIKKTILNNNHSSLEWLSITRKGMTYIVRIEERIITKIEEEKRYAHLISSKDALITKVISSKGSVLVRSGEYIKKNDILISGEIKLYDNVMSNVFAKGEVYGEVWYKTEVSYPKQKEIKDYTGKKRFNISINNKSFFKNKYQKFDQENYRKIKIFWWNVSFCNELEYKLKIISYTEEETIKLALKKIEDEFIIKLKGKGRVISQNVLKKEENNSTMNIRVFVTTNELISKIKYYDIGSDEFDPKNSS